MGDLQGANRKNPVMWGVASRASGTKWSDSMKQAETFINTKENHNIMRFIFIGPRSIGKSTVGKVLAQKLNFKYFDFDEYVELKINGIDQHIKNNSVESYRIEEEKILKQFILELPKKCVVSVGGGTVASQFQDISLRNAKILKSVGTIIYLSPSEDKEAATKILLEREQKRKDDKDHSETIKLFEIRKSVYEKIFDIKIEVKNKSPSEIVEDIILNVSAE